MRKLFLTLGAIVLTGIAGALYFINYRLDGVVETRIEKAATMALGTAVQVAGVHTNLSDGTLNITEISVANPPGYENPYAVRLHEVNAAVDYSAREIKNVVIDNPEFVIEESDGRTNFEQMLQALDARAAAEPGNLESAGEKNSETPAGNKSAGDNGGSEPVIVIQHFRINETRAVFESQSLDRHTDLKVDAIELNDLRGTPSELATLIARKVVDELNAEAAKELLKAQAKHELKGVGGKASDILHNLLGGSTGDDSGAESGAESGDEDAVNDGAEEN